MINAWQLENLVIKPELERLSDFIPYSQEAVDLLMMTAAHESGLGHYLSQIKGPARGIYQIEVETLKCIDSNWLSFKRDWQEAVCQGGEYTAHRLTGDLLFATRVARVQYYRRPGAIPKRSLFNTDEAYLWALAEYCKFEWNTEYGKANIEDYYDAYMELVAGRF